MKNTYITKYLTKLLDLIVDFKDKDFCQIKNSKKKLKKKKNYFS